MKPLNARGPGKTAASVASWVAIYALAAFLGLAGLVAAAHGGVDQITDPAGDAVASAELAGLPDDPMLRENLTANQTLADITHAWIQFETAQNFMLLIQVDDIPDGWGLPEEPPEDEIWSTTEKSVVHQVAHFQIDGAEYHAVARLHSAFDGSLMAVYHVVDAGGNQTGVAGGFDTADDQIWLMIPKSLLGVTDSSVLSHFYVYSKMDNATVDFAPDADYLVDAGEEPGLPGLPDDPVGEVGGTVEDPPEPESLLAMIAVPDHIEPNYGADYAFGQYTKPSSGGSGSGGSGVTAAIKITAAELQGTVAPSAVHTYQITLQNDGDATDTVRLSLNNAPAGWAHELSADAKGELELAAGATRDVSLLVSANEDAEKQSFRSVVSYASSGGQTGSVSILNLLGDGDDTMQDPDSQGEGQAEGEGSSPGIALPVLLPTLAVAAWFATRRRAD